MTFGYEYKMERVSIQLSERIDQNPVIGRVMRGNASAEQYVAFLRASYHLSRWLGQFLAASAGELRKDGYDFPALDVQDVRAEEEAILHDLERLGERTDVLRS